MGHCHLAQDSSSSPRLIVSGVVDSAGAKTLKQLVLGVDGSVVRFGTGGYAGSVMKKRGKLPIIHELKVQKPCHESWDDMQGDKTRRHCEACGHSVINLSELSEQSARSVLAEAQSKRICVRYTRNADGQIKFKPDSSWSARVRRRVALALTFLPILFGTLSSSRAEDRAITTTSGSDKNTACQGNKQQPPSDNHEIGKLAHTESPAPHAAQSQPTPEPTPIVEMGYPSSDYHQPKSEISDESKF